MKYVIAVIVMGAMLFGFVGTARAEASFTLGADVSWITEMEHNHLTLRGRDGQARDCFEILKEFNLSAVRLRVWVDPSAHGGWGNAADVLVKARRAQAAGLAVMIDFHYSDWWADPNRQPMPAAWKGLSRDGVVTALARHTEEVLALLKRNGIRVTWVQVGNETSHGLLWSPKLNADRKINWETKRPHIVAPEMEVDAFADLYGHPENYAACFKAGYAAVKRVYPEAIVIVHHADSCNIPSVDYNLEQLAKYGAKWDMIGLSLYPYHQRHRNKDEQKSIDESIATLHHLAKRWNCDTMIVETGFECVPEKYEEGRSRLAQVIRRSKSAPRCRGVFYWEPQCNPRFHKYSLGAFDDQGRPTPIMAGFLEPKPLPVARAPFARVGGRRQEVELRSWFYRRGTFSPSKEQFPWAEFVAGDKSLLVSGEDNRVRGNNPTWFNRLGVYAGKTVPTQHGRDLLAKLSINLPGEKLRTDKPQTNDVRKVDPATATVSWRRAWKLDDGADASFGYMVRPDGVARVRLDYDAGAASETIRALKHKGDYTLNLTVPKGVACQVVGNKVELEPDNPAKHVTLTFPRPCGWKDSKDGATLLTWWISDRTGSISVDFHESSAPRVKPPPQEGAIDFWATDALHVPVKPGRNRVYNGSFEQGLAGWWYSGWMWNGWSLGTMKKFGDVAQQEIVEGGRQGRKAVRYRVNGDGAVEGFRTLPMALRAGRPHTLSIWAKGEPLKGGAMTLGVHPRAVGEQNKVSPVRKGEKTGIWEVVGKDWKKFVARFVPDEGGMTIDLSGWGDGWITVDALQVEEGEEATDFDDAPVYGVLRTSDPENHLHTGQPIEARLVLTGEAGVSGRVTATVVNFYSEDVYRESFDFTLGVEGTATQPLAFDADRLGTGVFVLRTDFAVAGRAWTDYCRFQIIDPLGTSKPISRFFAHFPWFKSSSNYAKYPRRMIDYGIGGTSWAVNGEYAQGPQAELYRKVGMVNRVHVLQSEFPKYDPVNFGWRKPGFAAYSNDTARILKFIENVAYESGKTCYPDDTFWALGNEEELGNPMIKTDRNFEGYFEWQMAAYRGLRRAFDERGLKLMYGPTHGTCSFNPGNCREVMEGYLATARKHGFRYDFISVHMYWAMDGAGRLGSYADREENAAALVKLLDTYGYPATTPTLFTESSNMLPMYIPSWGAVDWSDHYTGTIPSAALGNREFVHAGTLARIYLMDLKRWPRHLLTHTWQRWIAWDMEMQPFFWPMVMNTIGHLLPDPRYVDDFRPTPTAIGYCYRSSPTATDGVLALWTNDIDVENGVTTGETLTLALPEDAAFVDLMGNPRAAARRSDGSVQVPLTAAPIFVRSSDVDGLVRALRTAQSDRMATVAQTAWSTRRIVVPERTGAAPGVRVPLTEHMGGDGALTATADLAWTRQALEIRVEVRGAKTAPVLRLALDGLGDARQIGVGKPGPDDSAYLFSGREIRRLKAVNTQFADGTTNAASDNEVVRDFVRSWTPTADGGIWRLTLVPRFLTPVRLLSGTRFGMTLTVSAGAEKVALSSENGDSADENALVWPLFELSGN